MSGTPPKPLPSSRKSSIGGLLANRFLDGAKDLPPRKRLVAVAAVLALAAAGAIGVFGWGLATDWWAAKPREKRQQEVQRQIDQEKEPFTATADYETSLPAFGKIVLDRTLTAEETAKLEAIPFSDDFGAQAWELLRPLGARILRYTTTMNQTPPGFDQGEAHFADATNFKLNIFSERSGQLVIVGMRAVNVSCRPPAAKTVVEFGGQGESEYPGVLFDLTRKDVVPFITDDGDDQGKPYFDKRKIDLGGGASPGALSVEAIARNQTCDWEIEARYNDPTQKGATVILRDGDKPFTADAVPSKPEQYWVTDPGTFTLVPCHKRPTADPCALVAQANGR